MQDLVYYAIDTDTKIVRDFLDLFLRDVDQLLSRNSWYFKNGVLAQNYTGAIPYFGVTHQRPL